MNVKIQGGGQGAYSNTGSCVGVTNYLSHEDLERSKEGQELEQFFTHDRDNISAKEVTYKIDHNKAKLCNNDSKFFVVTVSPSQDEIKAMGKTKEEQVANFKAYVSDGVMNLYGQGFNKGLDNKDLMYFAKIHHSRDGKAGDQMHAHIIVSRKDINDKVKLSPQTNHKGAGKGAVKSGFNRTDFFRKSEMIFDKAFNYRRDFKQSFEYQNTIKNGTLEDVKKLDNVKHQHEQRQEQNRELHQRIAQEQRQQQSQGQGRNGGKGMSR